LDSPLSGAANLFADDEPRPYKRGRQPRTMSNHELEALRQDPKSMTIDVYGQELHVMQPLRADSNLAIKWSERNLQIFFDFLRSCGTDELVRKMMKRCPPSDKEEESSDDSQRTLSPGEVPDEAISAFHGGAASSQAGADAAAGAHDDVFDVFDDAAAGDDEDSDGIAEA